jgi:hypothetical protein
MLYLSCTEYSQFQIRSILYFSDTVFQTKWMWEYSKKQA